MNNKPVAWRKVVGNVTKHYQYNEMGEGTPLYTHPSEHDLGIAEAISEASKDDQEIIRDYIEQRDWAKLGQKLYVMSYDYMEHFAQMEAQRKVSNGL